MHLVNCWLIASVTFAQSASPSSPYRSLLGCWTGTNDYTSNGQARHEDVLLTITEDAQRQLMRWESVYEPTAGQKDQVIKYVRFDIAKSKLEMHNEGVAKQRWAVNGFERFVAEGQGTLTATELKPRDPLKEGFDEQCI